MATETRSEWNLGSLARARDILLALAFCVPLAGVTLGSAIGAQLDRLGGVMVAYWALISIAAIVEFGAKPRRLGSRQWLIISMIFLPLGAKVVSGFVAQPMPVAPSVTEVAQKQQAPSAKGCTPEIVTRQRLSVDDSKQGSSGRWAWYFGIGNYYEWKFELHIKADNSGASGTASAVARVSSWYSIIPHPKAVSAFARGNVECRLVAGSCACFPDPAGERKTEGDFVVSVDVQPVIVPAGANLKVASSADLSGTMALAGVSVGQDPVRATLQAPNTARGGTSISQGYSYRCAEF